MASYSPFAISTRDAGALLRNFSSSDDNRRCYMIQITLETVYGDGKLPQSTFKKLPRLVNGIPLGPGIMAQHQKENVRWKYIEGSLGNITFISVPIPLEEAETTRTMLKDRLVKEAKALFGDITVKATVILAQCVNFDSEFFINDIAESLEEGLHFHD